MDNENEVDDQDIALDDTPSFVAKFVAELTGS